MRRNGWASRWRSGCPARCSSARRRRAARHPATASPPSGLTAGIDWRAADNLIVGAALGFGTDRTDIGQNGTRSDATSFSATLYASYKPFDPWFIDATLGFGTLGYDTRRFVTNDGITVDGHAQRLLLVRRDQHRLRIPATTRCRLKPYVRADFMAARSTAMASRARARNCSTYDSMGFNSVAGTLGLRGSYDIPVQLGRADADGARGISPCLSTARSSRPMYYTDLGPSVSSVLSQGSATRGMLNTSLGIRARGVGGMTAELEYGTSSAGAAVALAVGPGGAASCRSSGRSAGSIFSPITY